MATNLTPKSKATLPLTALLQLNCYLRRSLQKTIFSRNFYQQVNDKILSNTSTLDANLYFICYFTLLLSSILNNKHRIKTFLVAQKHNLLKVLDKYHLVSFQKSLLKKSTDPSTEKDQSINKKVSEKDVVQSEDSGKVAVVPSNLAVHLKQISSYISDIRIFHRLTEAIKYMPWIIDEFTNLMNPTLPVPRLDRLVNFVQAINCLVLELFENFGWLTDHNWIGTTDNNYWCIETYIWSSRVWGAYLLIEIIELLRRTPSSKRNKEWKIALFTQAIQVPLVAHWSLYDGCLSPFWVGLCGSGASFFGFRNTWKKINLS